MASSQETTGVTDETHPPSIIRPIVHLLALRTIGQGGEHFETIRQQFVGEASRAVAQDTGASSLNRRFRSVPALMFVRLETVSDVLTTIVNHILEMRLEIMKNKSVTEILREIRDSNKTSLPVEAKLPAWGDDPSISEETFVLDFPAELLPSYTTPGVSIRPDGYSLPFLRNILRLLGR